MSLLKSSVNQRNSVDIAQCLRSETVALNEFSRLFPVLHEDSKTPYLVEKGLSGVGKSDRGIRVGWDYDDKPFIAIPAEKFTSRGKSNKPSSPKLVGYQRIYEDGSKRFQAGFSPNDSFFQLGSIPEESLGEASEINLVIGYTTGLSVWEGFDKTRPVVGAFLSSNLTNVAKQLRKRYPNHKIVGRTDNLLWSDYNGVESHQGYKAMRAAMNAVNGTFTLPSFDGLICAGVTGKDCKPTDYNDLHKLAGIEELKRQLHEAVEIPEQEAPLKFYPSVDKAVLDLRSCIDNFFLNGKSHIISSSAGIGKTQACCDIIAKNPDAQVAYYVPSHTLATEVETKLRELGVNALAIQGRRLLCEKNDVADMMISLGGHRDLSSTLCKNSEGDKCSHFETCRYIKQFSNTKPQVVILQHAHLPLFYSKYERQLYHNHNGPDYLVIDESFQGSFFSESSIKRDDFYNSKDIPSQFKEDLLTAFDWDKPVLKTLRDKGYTGAKLKAIAEQVPSHYPSFTDVSPAMSSKEQINRLSKKTKGAYLRKPIKLLAEELELTEHDDSMGVCLVNNHNDSDVLIKSYWSKKFTRNKIGKVLEPTIEDTTYIPTLVLDASVHPLVVKSVLCEPNDIPITYINVRRNAYVTQLISSAVSKITLKNDERFIEDAANIAQELVKQDGGDVMLVSSQDITGNINNPDKKPHALLNDLIDSGSLKVGHFNALRGSNYFKYCKSGIILGRNQPPLHAIEGMGRAFFRLDDEQIKLGSEKVPTAYNLSDGTQEYCNVWKMNDHRCDIFLKSSCQDETGQALDRLRLVHHAGAPKKVYILSNVPIPGLIVDELITTRELRGSACIDKGSALLDKFFMRADSPDVMPLSPGVLWGLDGVSDLFKNKRSVQNWLARNAKNGSLEKAIFSSGRNARIVHYRVEGQRGRSMQVLTGKSDVDTETYLTRLYGKEVKIEGKITISGDANSAINRILLNPLSVTGDDILEEIAFQIDDDKSGAWRTLFNGLVEYFSTKVEETKQLSAYEVCYITVRSQIYKTLC